MKGFVSEQTSATKAERPAAAAAQPSDLPRKPSWTKQLLRLHPWRKPRTRASRSQTTVFTTIDRAIVPEQFASQTDCKHLEYVSSSAGRKRNPSGRFGWLDVHRQNRTGGAERETRAAKRKESYDSQLKADAGSSAAQSYFRATGFNVSLKKTLVFEGNYTALHHNSQPRLMKPRRAGNAKKWLPGSLHCARQWRVAVQVDATAELRYVKTVTNVTKLQRQKRMPN